MDTSHQRIWDQTDALRRVVGHEQILKAVVESFLDSMPICAQQLAEDLSKKDVEAAAKSAHSLKGGAANLSALALADICGDIELACRNNVSLDEVLILHSNFVEIFQQSCNALSEWQHTQAKQN